MKKLNDLNKKINNKDRTIMNMKINLISDYVCDNNILDFNHFFLPSLDYFFLNVFSFCAHQMYNYGNGVLTLCFGQK